MEKSFKPHKKYFSKVLLIQVCITIYLVLFVLLLHFIISAASGNLEIARGFWIGLLITTILLWIISTPIAYLWIKNLEYVIQNDRVQIHKGILTKTQQNIPFRAITDFALERTIFDRMLGLGSIKIQTAGQSHQPSGYEGKLGGLTDYHTWHEELRKKVKALYPVAEMDSSEDKLQRSDDAVLEQILQELREIKSIMEKH
ncbi:MAG: PH domain-containing protein [Calditrichaceae bacterium]|nr:PH domain-containing protein [Calditrichaceae bacterium]MBN2708454.1 PH domain-containing protein [Calditrichaceae bacterium]RQV93068.1 MAG: hypothetical protein EH224_13460 [Calditrichota bacterium]